MIALAGLPAPAGRVTGVGWAPAEPLLGAGGDREDPPPGSRCPDTSGSQGSRAGPPVCGTVCGLRGRARKLRVGKDDGEAPPAAAERGSVTGQEPRRRPLHPDPGPWVHTSGWGGVPPPRDSRGCPPPTGRCLRREAAFTGPGYFHPLGLTASHRLGPRGLGRCREAPIPRGGLRGLVGSRAGLSSGRDRRPSQDGRGIGGSQAGVTPWCGWAAFSLAVPAEVPGWDTVWEGGPGPGFWETLPQGLCLWTLGCFLLPGRRGACWSCGFDTQPGALAQDLALSLPGVVALCSSLSDPFGGDQGVWQASLVGRSWPAAPGHLPVAAETT